MESRFLDPNRMEAWTDLAVVDHLLWVSVILQTPKEEQWLEGKFIRR